ncbi:MAG: UbiH/UbiF/VisC/COQ6 family ubiquinone biosynthesis hydroxylase [Caulobacterales bacterium]
MSQTSEDAQVFSDVLVIGGGVSGLVAALAASQAGFQTVLADAGDIDGQKPLDSRAFAMAPASMQLFDALGLSAKLTPKAEPVLRMAIADAPKARPQKSSLRLDFRDCDATGNDEILAYIVENTDLYRALVSAAHVAANLKLVSGRRLKTIVNADGRATAQFDGGAAISAQLIIGADGRNSSVRNLCAVDGTGWDYGQTAITATVAHEQPHQNVAHDLFLPAGPLGVLPLNGRRSSIVWCETPDAAAALMRLEPGAFCAELQTRLAGRLGALTLESRRSAFPLSVFVANSMIAPRVALVADAAHSVHPLAGQGLNIGLRDIAALADTLIDARAIGLDIGAETTLERYQRWRRFDNLSYAAATDALNRVFALQAPPLRAMRSAGLAAVNAIAPLRKMFASEASGVSENAPRLLRGEALDAV